MTNIKKEILSHFIGFVQGDGHLRKYSIYIQISSRDKKLLEEYMGVFKDYDISLKDRTYDTNFKKDFHSSTLTIKSKELVEFFNANGTPYGKKSDIISPPSTDTVNRIDYIRGLIDADGSLGLTSEGFPFISIVLSSDEIKNYYIKFIKDYTGLEIRSKRNKRDNVYNIFITREHAQTIIKLLYYGGCFGLERKIEKAKEALSWVRPEGVVRSSNRKMWLEEDDLIVLNNDIEEASKLLGRSIKSINTRKWRLLEIQSKRVYTQYSKEEIEFLSTKSLEECLNLLNRSEKSIKSKFREVNKSSASNRKWTTDEIKLLSTDKTAKELSLLLNRTEDSIYNKTRRLKLS